jgi:hypothetical protein
MTSRQRERYAVNRLRTAALGETACPGPAPAVPFIPRLARAVANARQHFVINGHQRLTVLRDLPTVHPAVEACGSTGSGQCPCASPPSACYGRNSRDLVSNHRQEAAEHAAVGSELAGAEAVADRPVVRGGHGYGASSRVVRVSAGSGTCDSEVRRMVKTSRAGRRSGFVTMRAASIEATEVAVSKGDFSC